MSHSQQQSQDCKGGGFSTSKFLLLISFYDLNKDLTSLGFNFLIGKSEMIPLLKRMWVKGNRDCEGTWHINRASAKCPTVPLPSAPSSSGDNGLPLEL